jgi:hypothetical protein
LKRNDNPSVFIIESLSFDDEQHNRFEGRFLSQILHLGEKESTYFYVQTKGELKKALRLFGASQYRYLHLSCHGSRTTISTTLDQISFSQLGELLQPYLENKRLFLSACSAVNDNLARYVIPSSKCISIIGPATEIPFSDAAIIWASFYHLVFKENPEKMGRGQILATLHSISDTFQVSLNYFWYSEDSERLYKNELIAPKPTNSERE